MPHPVQIDANRSTRKYSKRVLVARVLWIFGAFVFRLVPRPCYAVRSWLLRMYGAKIGQRVHVYPTVRIQFPWNLTIGDFAAIGDHARIYNLGPIQIGSRATISQFSHLCAGSHDYQSPTMALLKLPITVGEDAWVCADAFVGPGVTIGDGAVVGARAVVVKDVPAWTVVAGNPAKEVKKREIQECST